MKRMNRMLSLMLAGTMAVSLTACGNGSTPTTTAAAALDTTAAATTEAAAAATLPEHLEGDTFGNSAIGKNGGVASSSEYASAIGLKILQAGGNAIDAAVATAFAVGVVEPQYSSVGGAGLMTIYLANEKRCTTIEYLETVPMDIVPDWYNGDTDKYTAKNAAVPAQVHGLLTALAKYGTMTPAEVLAPVIELAKSGYVVNSSLATALSDGYEHIMATETATSIYTVDGFPIEEGQTIVNEPLAETLQKIADGGIDEFYKGDLAKKIVEGLQANGSLITMEDMAAYTCVEREPISTNYRGYDVVTVSAPSNGGNMLLETLNILENYDLKAMGLNSYEYLLTMNEAMRIGWTDSYTILGDPAFFNLPIDRMISKEYAKSRLDCMPKDGVSQFIDKAVTKGDLVATPVESSAPESQHTTHISVIDKDGNIVATTNTLGLAFGCSYMVDGTGFFLNSHISNMTHDSAKASDPDFVIGGKRVRSTMSPTIVLKDGTPVMAIGSPGSLAIPCAIATVLNNVLLFDMNIQEAINAPRGIITTRSKPYSKMTVEADRMDPAVVQKFTDSGYTMDNKGEFEKSLGGIAAIYIDQESGLIEAGADPRREYKALAY